MWTSYMVPFPETGRASEEKKTAGKVNTLSSPVRMSLALKHHVTF